VCEFAGFFDETSVHQNAENSSLSDGDAITDLSAQQGPTTGYAPVNGLRMYYEVHGRGEPVVLLHGAFMTITSNWEGWIGELSKTRKVIAVAWTCTQPRPPRWLLLLFGTRNVRERTSRGPHPTLREISTGS
jgi:hypothetical protein